MSLTGAYLEGVGAKMAYRYEARSSAWILLFPPAWIISPRPCPYWQHRNICRVEMLSHGCRSIHYMV